MSDKDMFDVVLGVCSKFTMEDINYLVQNQGVNKKKELIQGVHYLMSPKSKEKFVGVLAKHGFPVSYFSDAAVWPEWRDLPDQDLKIKGLTSRVVGEAIVPVVRENPELFFNILESSSNPPKYANQIIYAFDSYSDKNELVAADKAIYNRLVKIRKRGTRESRGEREDITNYSLSCWRLEERLKKVPGGEPVIRDSAIREGDTLIRRGLSKILGLTTRYLPATEGRKAFKRAIVKGYRHFYPGR